MGFKSLKACCSHTAFFFYQTVKSTVVFLCVSMYNSHIKLRADFKSNTTQPCPCFQKPHSSEDKLKEALDVSMSHFLLLMDWGLFCPSLWDLILLAKWKFMSRMIWIPFGKELQPFPCPKHPFKELSFLTVMLSHAIKRARLCAEDTELYLPLPVLLNSNSN